MEKKTINDIAQILEDIKKDQAEDVLTERKDKPQEISIDDLIKRLQNAKKEGYKNVKIDGWLYGEKGSTSSIIATNSFYG